MMGEDAASQGVERATRALRRIRENQEGDKTLRQNISSASSPGGAGSPGLWRLLYSIAKPSGSRTRRTARRTLAGYEAMAMIRKGQVRNIGGSDMRAQAAFVAGLFG